MTQIRMFDLTPPVGSGPDLSVFQRYRIEESTDGLVWTIIEGPHDLVPAVTNPAAPPTYSFVTNDASELATYFRVVWSDQSEIEVATPPMIRPYPLPAWTPSLGDVADFIPVRTKMPGNGVYANTFNDKTHPTNIQVERAISKAVEDVVPLTGRVITDPDEANTAKNLAAMRAAMLIELGLFSQQVEDGKSPYNEFKQIWDDETGTDTDNESGSSLLETRTPSFKFPHYRTLMDERTHPDCRAPGTNCRGECLL